MTNTRPSSPAFAFVAGPAKYQIPPTASEMSKSEPPVVKNSAMVNGVSTDSAKSGLTEPNAPSDAGPVNPMVAYESSAISG